MKVHFWQNWKREPLFPLIGLGLILLPVSNAAGQVPLYLASVVWAVRALRQREPVNRRTLGFLAGYAVVILVSMTYALDPGLSLGKLNRFLLFPLSGAVYAVCMKAEDPLDRVYSLCLSFVVGVCILGLYDFVQFPLEIRSGVEFVDVGNMTSPQFYLVAILLLLGLWSSRPEKLGLWFWLMLAIVVVGLLLHQKRGVWLACAISVGLWTLWARRWKTMGLGILVVGISLCFPYVQDRLSQLTEVVKPTHGGRMILWTGVAPRLLPEYPWGIGFNNSTYELFREVLPEKDHMEVGLDHLHNNLLQIRLELGWHGVIGWGIWMLSMLWTAFRPLSPEVRLLRAGVSFALLGLLLNGLVEYNFGDSEIQKVFLVLFGLLDVFPNSWGGKASAADALNHGGAGNLNSGDVG